ncbi:hypothetical protein BVX97_02060 [bacterium E08(2017)]|nr:hypothetical protein BVX97_02060 [bacterium E08(2017)]
MKNKFLFWVPLVLFIILCCWWVTYFPYNRELLYRAIPASSDIIIEKPGVYYAWQSDLTRNYVRDLSEAAGMDESLLEQFEDGSDIGMLLEAVARKNTVISFVPSLSPEIKPAVVISTWAGTKGQLIGWNIKRLLGSEVSHQGYDYNLDMWSIDLKKEPDSDRYLSFAFYEGVMAACLSHREFGIDYILERMVHGRTMAPALSKRLEGDEPGGDIWMLAQNAKLYGTQSLSVSADRAGAGPLNMRLEWTDGNPFKMCSIVPGYEQYCDEVSDLLGDAPGVLAIAPYQFFEWQLVRNDRYSRLAEVRKLISENAVLDTPMFAAVCVGKYSGRMRGIRVPSLIIGMKLKEPGNFSVFMHRALDLLNTEHKLNVIAVGSEVSGRTIYSVDRVTGEFFKGMGANERPAFSLAGDWLIAASNTEVINRIYEMDSVQSPVDGIDFGKSMFSCWADLPSVESALVKMVAINDLISIASGKQRDTQSRHIMTAVLSAIRALQDMDTCWVMSIGEKDETVLNVTIGADE